jgi:hypothetical protein
MSNMSYCRFENTYHDLQDCMESMDDDDLSTSEEEYRRRLIQLSKQIAEEYGNEMEEE